MVNGHGTVPRVAGSCECYGVRVDVERARDTIAAEQPRRLRLDAGRSRPPEDPDRRKIPTGAGRSRPGFLSWKPTWQRGTGSKTGR